MWKVSNNLNNPILNRYADVISSFFKLIIDLSKVHEIEDELEKVDFLEENFDNAELLDKRLLTLNKSGTNEIKPIVKSIILLGTARLEEEFAKYTMQNHEVSNLNYNLIPQEHPEPLRKMFKDYFYDKFFGVEWIWTDLVGKGFNREGFKTNFKEENKLYVCPYCDSETISNTRNAWIEHFLPKGKFPYLACNPKNLIPSCTSCNVSGSGKGEVLKNPISTQYQLQIGDEIEFNFKNGKISIEPHVDNSIENFVELLKLRKRYDETSVNASVISTLKINYNTINKLKRTNEFEKDVFFDFIHDIGRNKGYYFVQKNLLNFIDEI